MNNLKLGLVFDVKNGRFKAEVKKVLKLLKNLVQVRNVPQDKPAS